MDENKLDKLLQIGYILQPVCYNCKHSNLNGMWGTCKLHTYQHKKHTKSLRQLSINQFGCCNNFEIKEDLKEFHRFSELLMSDNKYL